MHALDYSIKITRDNNVWSVTPVEGTISGQGIEIGHGFRRALDTEQQQHFFSDNVQNKTFFLFCCEVKHVTRVNPEDSLPNLQETAYNFFSEVTDKDGYFEDILDCKTRLATHPLENLINTISQVNGYNNWTPLDKLYMLQLIFRYSLSVLKCIEYLT